MAMSRAAFLPSPIDPFVLLHCIHYFKSVWYDEVDKLYICLNSNVETSVVNELMDELKDPKIVIYYTNHTLGHGKALSLLLDQCEEDAIMFIEDDSIIFKKGVVDEYFRIIESGKLLAIGSPRMSCPKEVADEAKEEYGLNYEGFGDRGPAFWPCFFFTSTNALHLIYQATNRNLGASDKGDTFVKASLEYREMAKHLDSQKLIKHIPQYHCTPDDEQYKGQGLSIFDGKCGYMHFGSLSSGFENTLLDDNDLPLKDRKNPTAGKVTLKPPQTIQEKIELTRRVMWWNEAYKMNIDKFGEFGEQYGKAIEKVIDKCGLSWSDINSMRKMYMGVIHG